MTDAPATATAPTRTLPAPLVHAVVAIITTAPLAWRMFDRLPLGREPVATVPFFNLWSLAWTAQRIPHALDGWWDAPIFWPARGAYAGSELQPLTATVYWMLRPLIGATGAYGLILLVALTLTGLGANRLARRLGVGPVAALAGGVLAQTMPFLFQQVGVLQLMMLWPVAFGAAALFAWADTRSTRTAAALGLWIATALLTCGYHAVLGFGTLAVAALALPRRDWVRDARRRLGDLVLVVAIVAAVAGPFLVGQSHALGSVRWTDATIRAGSSTWHDLGPAGDDWIGVWLLVGGLAGVTLGYRHRPVRVLALWAVLATLVAAGLHLTILGGHPYEWLIHRVDALGRLRSPFRATAFAQLAAAVLSAVALDRLWHTRAETRRWAARILTVGLVVAAVVSVQPTVGRLVRLPETDTAMVRWLRRHPGGAAMYAPVAATGHVEAFEPTTVEMWRGLVHHHPLVNGYSGFFPEDADEMLAVDRGFPSVQSVVALRERDVRYVFARRSWWRNHHDDLTGPYEPRVVARPAGWVVLDVGG